MPGVCEADIYCKWLSSNPVYVVCRMVQYEIGNGQSGNDSVSQRVVAAVADARDEDPLELPPLYGVIDPDALDQLFDRGVSGRRPGPGRVIFMLADCEVVVHSDGEVDVTAPGDRESSSSVVDAVGEQDEAETTLD